MSLAKKIAIQLYWKFRSSSEFLLPRYTPKDWWECDIWRLTQTGMVNEYEIKLSVSDFRADVKKEQEDFTTYRTAWQDGSMEYQDIPKIKKHQLLKDGDARCPNRFWFVVPSEIADRIVVPSYAGLVIFSGYSLYIQKQAPKIHKKKWEGDRVRLLHTFYHRYWAHEAKSKDSDIDPTIVAPES